MAAPKDMIKTENVFNNHGLFSNHFLETKIPKTAEWKEDDKAKKALEEISALINQNEKALANYKEAQLEENFIRPVLKVLGHFYGIQGKVEENARVPDYAFFPDQASLDEAYILQGTQDFYKKALAVGDAKAWGISLDKSQQSGKGMWDKQNPSYQIDTYLRDTPPVWGFLTNGRQWRLYHESTSYKLDVYYEVDLPSLVNSGVLEDFKYFYLFFRFEAIPKFPGDSFLDRTREGSQAYAKEIGKGLQENVYKAMQKLAEGFFADSSNCLTRSKEDLKAVQDNSMLLLYRVLFIFYAESRGLLNSNNRFYRGMSLYEMKKEIANKRDAGEFLAPFSNTYWGRLTNLFNLINEGSESERWKIDRKVLYIPAYNGGLFDPAKNTFLSNKQISDFYLAEALDLLARSDKAMVDYSSLDIRHLGSIYEGLLEYRLTSELSLLTDKGERKATGSYFTPDYIVKYIVENTLGPVIAQKKAEWVQLLDRTKFADYILSIKVLDPAMGSGHFLVEAVDYLARALVEAWATAKKEDAKTKEVAEHDIQWARREVVRRCIYGVDLNPMAVELAKLALWLTTAAANKPLSFLDHHLRCGNSLIGSNLDSLTTLQNSESGSGPLQEFFAKQRKKLIDGLLRKFEEIDSTSDDNLKVVKEKEQKYKELMGDEPSRRIREVANVRLSAYFGNMVKGEDYEWMSNGIDCDLTPEWGGIRDLDWFKQAQQIAHEIRFFNWEIEYPEAFTRGGFDAVIGNPPYGANYTKKEKNFFQSIYSYKKGKPETYIYFIELGISLLKNDGILGYITPNAWLTNYYGIQIRRHLLESTSLYNLVDLEPVDVFETVEVDTAIVICRRCAYKKECPNTLVSRGTRDHRINEFFRISQGVWLADPDAIINLLATPEDLEIIEKMNSGHTLGELVEYSQGVIPYETKVEGDSNQYIALESQGDGWLPLIERASQIQRYNIDMPEAYINYGPWLGRSREQRFFSEPKILFHRLRKKLPRQLVGAIDESGVVNRHALSNLILRPGLEPKTLFTVLGLFNSILINWWFAKKYGLLMEVGGFKISNIPLPIEWDEECVGMVPLVMQMLDLHRQKQSEVQGFLKWIGGEIGTKVEDLSGAYKLQEYYDLDLTGFHAILIKNKRKLKEGYNPSARSQKELLTIEFESSVSKLKSLIEEIDRTDRQIDALVYELYGLTEKDIRIVEKATE